MSASVSLRNVSHRRGRTAILDRVAFAAESGEFIALVGPNGAGKSTLLRLLAGLERPSEGEILLDGAGVAATAPIARARRLAYLPQEREAAFAIEAGAVVALGRYAYGSSARLGPADAAAVSRALAATDAEAFRHRTMPTLSGGERARVHLARAFAAETPVLLADEPTAALDLKHALSIIRALRAKADDGGLVIAALHDLALARAHATRIIALDGGRVAADGPPAAALNADLLRRVFEISAADARLALGRAGDAL